MHIDLSKNAMVILLLNDNLNFNLKIQSILLARFRKYYFSGHSYSMCVWRPAHTLVVNISVRVQVSLWSLIHLWMTWMVYQLDSPLTVTEKAFVSRSVTLF